MISIRHIVAATFLALCWPQLAPAQEPGQQSAQEAQTPARDVLTVDALGRGTPNSSITGFLYAASKSDFETAADYLELEQLPEDVYRLGGPELARKLNHVLSRTVWFHEHKLSEWPDGEQGDGLPPDLDPLVVIDASWGEVPLRMQRLPREDGELIWKVSNRSVATVPRLYAEFGYHPWVEAIRDWFPAGASFLQYELFKWFIMVALVALSWPLFYFLGELVVRLFVATDSPTRALWRQVMTGPIAAIGVLVVISAAFVYLGAGAVAQELGRTNTLTTLAFIWASWTIINLIREHKQEHLRAQGRVGAAKLLPPMMRFLKIVILVLASLFWLNNLGVNITTLLAGLGVGGLALALALQKPLEDMMGALSLFTQVPIKVGDFCRYGDVLGTVEEIGLRTTRIRTLTDTLVSIPNARIAYAELENLSSRTKIRYCPTLRLRYDATPEQLRSVLANIEQMLEHNELVYDEPVRVRLTDFSEDAILIKLHAYIKTADYAESLKIAQDLNFRIFDIMDAAGVRFALPSQTVFLESNN